MSKELELISAFKESIKDVSKFYVTTYCKKYVLNNLKSDLVNAVKTVLKNTSSDYTDLELVWRYLAGTAKVCPICKKYHHKSKLTCSFECAQKLRKQIYLEKFGVDNPFKSEQIKDKIKHVLNDKYGVEHPSKSKVIQDKKVKTSLQKYGTKHPSQSEGVKHKIEQTNLNKYGVKHFLSAHIAREKIQVALNERYGVSSFTKTNVFKQKRKKTMIERYGTENALLSEQCLNKLLVSYQEKLIEDLSAKNVQNIRDLNKNFLSKFVIYINNIKYFNLETCKNHFNISYPDVIRIKKCFNIKIPNYYETTSFSRSDAEIELFNWIPSNNKISNDRTIISPYELDILLPDYKLAIEYDGVYWHSDEYRTQNYHLNKTIECNNKGIQLFHIFDTDDIDIWKSMICNKLNLSNKIYARKCVIKEITNKDAKSFCAQNHLQGACNSKINLGLFYNDELLEVMTFGKPRFTQKYQYELLRLCTKKYYSVIGGASKLWKYFLTKYSPKSVLSYANRRFSNGSIYETLGFKFINETRPNYWYFKHSSDKLLLSRLQCQKHKLSKLFDEFNPLLSEVENMKHNGYSRIFDCGNLVYVWKRN